MKSERRIEQFLRRIDVIPDAERKRLRLEALLATGDQTQTPTSVVLQPTVRRYIMNRYFWKIAAVLILAATAIGVIGIVQNGNQAAYAFGQTVAAMQGKRSFHIQTYYGSPTQRHDEFWAEFNENGKLIRVRQLDQWKKEQPDDILWDDGVEYMYTPRQEGGGTLVISQAGHHVDEDRLEEFDPETMIEDIYTGVENGEATIQVIDSLNQDGYLVYEATGNHPYRYVIFVDPETKLVHRLDQYDQNDEGGEEYKRSIEVLEYNLPFDPSLFEPDYPEETIIIDQMAGPVGMAQGDLRAQDVAVEVARQALEAWAADDYDTAGQLFGGAPKAFFDQRAYLKPLADIVVAEVNPYEWYGPTFMVKCSYVTEQDGELVTIKVTLWVKTNEGQPDRWFIDPANGIFREE